MRETEVYPRLAIILPHPTEREVCAIDTRTGTLPGLRIDVEPSQLSKEQIALQLAKTITGHGENGVDRSTSLYPHLTLTRMKLPRFDLLARPFKWQAFDMPTVIDMHKKVSASDMDVRGWPDRRELLERPAMQTCSIFVVNQALNEDNISSMRSYFWEEPGMYGLPLLSELLSEPVHHR